MWYKVLIIGEHDLENRLCFNLPCQYRLAILLQLFVNEESRERSCRELIFVLNHSCIICTIVQFEKVFSFLVSDGRYSYIETLRRQEATIFVSRENSLNWNMSIFHRVNGTALFFKGYEVIDILYANASIHNDVTSVPLSLKL